VSQKTGNFRLVIASFLLEGSIGFGDFLCSEKTCRTADDSKLSAIGRERKDIDEVDRVLKSTREQWCQNTATQLLASTAITRDFLIKLNKSSILGQKCART
jgi:hypothetical protein